MSWHVNTSAKDKAEARKAFRKAASAPDSGVPATVVKLVSEMISAIPGPGSLPLVVTTYGHFDKSPNGTSTLSITIANEPGANPDSSK